jgi:hypothetical protein
VSDAWNGEKPGAKRHASEAALERSADDGAYCVFGLDASRLRSHGIDLIRVVPLVGEMRRL